MDRGLVDVEVVLVRKTDEFLLVVREEDFEEEWLDSRAPDESVTSIPISEIHKYSEITEDNDPGDFGVLTIPAWLAEKKELL